MENIVMLVACLVIGMAPRWAGRVPENAHAALNAFIIHVSLPALILLQIHSVALAPGLLYAALMRWLLFAASTLLFCGLGRALHLPRATTGALAVVGGLGNTSFVGLPMIEAFYGPDGITTGIVVDQLVTYLVLSGVGNVFICFCAGGAITPREVVRRIATFPPLIALVLALALVPVAYPGWATSILSRLGATLALLALVSVGLQLRLGAIRGNQGRIAMGVGFKLVLGPLLILLLYAVGLHLRGSNVQVTASEASMGPQIGGSIAAMQYGLDAPLITLAVGLGTMLSFATLPLWWEVLRPFGPG